MRSIDPNEIKCELQTIQMTRFTFIKYKKLVSKFISDGAVTQTVFICIY